VHSVGAALCEQRFEGGLLRRVGGHDELAAALVRDATRNAVVEQPTGAIDAQLGLERSGRVVDARVDHAAVVRARFHARLRVLLEHADRRIRPALRDRQRRRQARDAGADDEDVDFFHSAQVRSPMAA
jgi:hypothetical protein